MKSFIILSAAAVLVVVFALGSGVYNMGASEKHWAITEKAITWVRESSIKAHAKNLVVPTIDETEIATTGAYHYDSMCIICHLAPGLEPTELSIGLYPQPPEFYERAPVTDMEEKLNQTKKYFWVIKNGIKMTGMPAWGATHDDESIWAIAKFVLKLHGMTPEQYGAFIVTDHGHGDHHQ
ncbi:MAG: hypothetical protein NMNS01_09630 [Nitrosomonas sp.]|jgi:mono/diheme cytochrome c family protein|nr:MAG: hypothetical protein NMNS01_09630 [Nitrosomonas sp.]